MTSRAPKLRGHFPYPEIRIHQEKVLETLEKNWQQYDTFLVSAPTAAGKSAISKAILEACQSASLITPTNLLVDQFIAEFPDTHTLRRLDSYRCAEWHRPCSVTRGKLDGFCKGCPAAKDLSQAKYRGGPGVYNYHTYLAHKLYREVLIVDEGHNLIPVIRDRMALTIWQHDYPFPSNMYTTEQQVAFINSLSPSKRRGKKIQLWLDSLIADRPDYIAQRDIQPFNGKGTTRGQPEDRECIRLLPVDITTAPPMFWPRQPTTGGPGAVGVRKVIILSATISGVDAATLGLSSRGRVLHIQCESPIPAANRPIVLDYVASVNRANLEHSTGEMARYIDEVLAPRHEGEKGVIHVTYQQARILAGILHGPRYLFHDKANKAEQYAYFRNASPESGMILIACGMAEGIDLPEDLGRWQVIAKVPWPSLGSPAVKYLAREDASWFEWETMKGLIQACGRICRTPSDQGVTYVLDGAMDRLLQGERSRELFPPWYLDAIVSATDWENSADEVVGGARWVK